jgi:CRP/FNR family transcriptional regulator, cyclic AMP receptor protein
MSTNPSARFAERLDAIRNRPAPRQQLVLPSASDPPEQVSLDGIRLFEALSAEERRDLEQKCVVRRFAAGAVMVERFSAGDSVFFLVGGVARIVHNIGQDGEFTIATVGAGNALGEIAAIDGQGRTATIVAESDCTVAEMKGGDFAALLGTHAKLGLDLLRRWASLIRQLDEKISFLATGSPDQRVYAELVRLAKPTSAGKDRWLIPDMASHRDIAMWAQTSREVVVRVLADLTRSGTIERRAKALHIHDYDGLRRLASGETEGAAPEAGAAG